MITAIAALWGQRWVVYVASAFIALGGYRAWLWNHDNKVRSGVVQTINKQAEKTSAKALEARGRAERVPDPAAELYRKSCRDC